MEEKIDVFGIILLLLGGIVVGMFIWWGVETESTKEKLDKGETTEKQYCEQYADDYKAPIRCYKYFGVTQVGTHMEGKVQVPTLVPN